MMMKSIAIGVLFALIPFAVSFLLYRRGKCSVWTVFVSLLIGLFSYVVLVMILVFLSGGARVSSPQNPLSVLACRATTNIEQNNQETEYYEQFQNRQIEISVI